MAIKPLIDGLDQLRHEVLDDEVSSFGIRVVWDQRFQEILDRLRHLDKLITITHERPDLEAVDVSDIVERTLPIWARKLDP